MTDGQGTTGPWSVRLRAGLGHDPGMNLALLVLRLVVGLGFAAHGMQKLFGTFGGGGIAGTGGFFEQVGLRPGRLHALAAGVLGGLAAVFTGRLAGARSADQSQPHIA
jgi:uncharacterized membrane protein YphA (DoxX/SURF4 family)